MAKSTRKTRTTLTVDEVVQDVIDILDDDQLDELRTSTWPALAYHRSLGMFIRNRYIHTDEFTIDTTDAGPFLHADGFSSEVVKRVLAVLRHSD